MTNKQLLELIQSVDVWTSECVKMQDWVHLKNGTNRLTSTNLQMKWKWNKVCNELIDTMYYMTMKWRATRLPPDKYQTFFDFNWLLKFKIHQPWIDSQTDNEDIFGQKKPCGVSTENVFVEVFINDFFFK